LEGGWCHGPYPGALLLRGLCGSLFLRGLCGSLFYVPVAFVVHCFLPQWLSPSGTNKSVASDVWLSRQWRNPAATNTYQSRLRPNRKGVSLSERTFRASQCRITLVSSVVRSSVGREFTSVVPLVRETPAEKSGISV
jgi:hypothetical protein